MTTEIIGIQELVAHNVKPNNTFTGTKLSAHFNKILHHLPKSKMSFTDQFL